MANNIEWAEIDDTFPAGLYHRPTLEAADPDNRLLGYDWDAAVGLGEVMIYAEGPDALNRLADWFALRADDLRIIADEQVTAANATATADSEQLGSNPVRILLDVHEAQQRESYQNATLSHTSCGLAVSVAVEAASDPHIDTDPEQSSIAARLAELLRPTGLTTTIIVGDTEDD